MPKVFGLAVVCALTAVTPTTGTALPLTLWEGTPIVAIDGDRDDNVTVRLLSVGGTHQFEYGYLLNGSPFTAFSFLDLSVFQGGDVIDFALQDRNSGAIYSLSGDAANAAYEVAMFFTLPVTEGSPEQPDDWAFPYYYNAFIAWTIHDTIVGTDELAINFLRNGNDGIAPLQRSTPVPEPAAAILLGSGLLGWGLVGRKKVRRSHD